MNIDTIICGDNVEVLSGFPDECIDLTVTSPPYDAQRDYKGYLFDFEGVARQLFRVTKKRGVVVWVVKDSVKNGNKSLTSFRQGLFFQDIGFNVYDVMIYEKECGSLPHKNRYRDAFEYMFVLSKGKPKTVNLIKDRKNKWGGTYSYGNVTVREKNGLLGKRKQRFIEEYGYRYNIWSYLTGRGHSAKDSLAFEHPAIFPEKLAHDHIYSWSNIGDLVLDPFVGSGTTCKMSKVLGRHFIGIDVSQEYCDLAKLRIDSANP